MFKRKPEGSVICTSCGVLVGVNDATCYNCGRRNPGLWGFGPALRALGNDLGFVSFVTGGTIIMFVLSLVMSRQGIQVMLSPSNYAIRILGASGASPVFEFGWWWTVLTASWLHGGIMHIFFNVMWIRQLGPEIANLYGAGRRVIIDTVAGVIGCTLSSWPACIYVFRQFLRQLTVGASRQFFAARRARAGRRSGASVGGRTAILSAHGRLQHHLSRRRQLRAPGGFGGYLASLNRSAQANASITF